MSEEIGHLPGRERADGSIRLFDSVDQIGGEGVSEGMESPLLQSSRLQNAVVSFPEVYRPGITSVFIRDERAVLSEDRLSFSLERCAFRSHDCYDKASGKRTFFHE